MTLEIQNILTGIDFSDAARAALDWSLALGRAHEARVRVIHAYVIPNIPYVEDTIVQIDEDRVVRTLQAELASLVEMRQGDASNVECRAVRGWPARAILEQAHEAGADLIVIGTRGLSGLPRLLMGSVAERVARTSGLPVLVVPEPASPPRTPGRIRKIVCGVDFSPQAAVALSDAAVLAKAHGAAIHVVHVWEPGALAKHTDLSAAHELALEEELETVARRCTGRTDTVHVVKRGTPYAAIVDLTRDIDADLVVLGSTGRSGPLQFLLGSVAERVLRASPVPVLVAR